MSEEIQTTGDLRAYLAKSILELRKGELDVEVASRMTKMAQQINESFYSEIKVTQVRKEAGDKKVESLGQLGLGPTRTATPVLRGPGRPKKIK